jgi:hypothetical protein
MQNLLKYLSTDKFASEFSRCCKEYSKLEMYVAWIGNPEAILPFAYLENLSSISAIIGVEFCHTHPLGIRFLMENGGKVRIAKNNELFHPKIYIFSKKRAIAVLIGSANFTYHGFYKNYEANILIEGTANDSVLADIINDVQIYKSDDLSFEVSENWLEIYAEQYRIRRAKLNDASLDDEAESEEKLTYNASWLRVVDWEIYLKKVNEGLEYHSLEFQENLEDKLNLFKTYSEDLAIPWNVSYFKTIENRRMMGGIGAYAWLGHIAATGKIRKIFANGTVQQHSDIVKSINSIGVMNHPLNWNQFAANLDRLLQLGCSMKVWGRLLAIVRPDLFCTISSAKVRKNIAEAIGISENLFKTADGYVEILKLIHSSPWFNSKAPKSQRELEIWKRRVAFLDVIFYN